MLSCCGCGCEWFGALIKILFRRTGPFSECTEAALIFLRGFGSNAGLSWPLSELMLTFRLAFCDFDVGCNTIGSLFGSGPSWLCILNLQLRQRLEHLWPIYLQFFFCFSDKSFRLGKGNQVSYLASYRLRKHLTHFLRPIKLEEYFQKNLRQLDMVLRLHGVLSFRGNLIIHFVYDKFLSS